MHRDIRQYDQHTECVPPRACGRNCSRIQGVPDFDGVTMALPHLIGGQGALTTIPLRLDDDEQAALRRSAGIVREAIESLKLG